MSVFALSLASCQDDASDININPEDIYAKTNIYPMPPDQWMGGNTPYFTSGYVGDVMPYYENGKFHLFFLHDAKTKPAGEGFHDIHSFETSNLTDFSYQGRMIPYGKSNEPDFAVGTGSMIKVGNTYYYYYTGHNATGSFLQDNPRESILLATSTDMKNWTKIKSFKMTAPIGYYDFEFRDPHVFYNEQESKYWMLISAQNDGDRKAVILKMTTTDPASGNWVSEGTIYTSSAPENYIMLECPDLFKMGNYWYLLFSENWSSTTGTQYRMSTSPNGPWIKPADPRFDGSYLYAAKTASDGINRYLFGWTARKVPESNSGGKDWAGNLVTHQLVQNADGTLGVKQPQAISSLFTQSTTLTLEKASGNATQNGNSISIGNNGVATFANLKVANQINFDLKISNSGSSGLILAHDVDQGNGMKIAFEPKFNRIAAYSMVNGTENFDNLYAMTFDPDHTYKINVTISNNVCIVYIDNKVAFSSRVYNVNAKKWSLFGDNNQSVYSNITIKNPK
ncbi:MULTISPECIES: glycoside hydrolase family 32 protein [Chryseobacterium]|uniref:glycoside hydrolase family 32 protein n=1 Tax=Chryseobacterium TaxID=59732 RepID=UPI00195A1896|nr:MULTISPECIES: glycoside hydrolase family 32 protein [Chryseobacterium]MBM7420255.1 beta-fructofuranosidase [Chryseobacterium sp. JUb44]WSO08916.1 glycoside hydrolase family 32 protein [Chryseobacterium scophthalmum]